jgi:hypothetical protein
MRMALSPKLNTALHPAVNPRIQHREERCSVKRYRRPTYRGELSNVLPLHQQHLRFPFIQNQPVRVLEWTVRRLSAKGPVYAWCIWNI